MTNGTITSSTYATESDGTYPVTVSANRFLLPEQGTFVIAYFILLIFILIQIIQIKQNALM